MRLLFFRGLVLFGLVSTVDPVVAGLLRSAFGTQSRPSGASGGSSTSALDNLESDMRARDGHTDHS